MRAEKKLACRKLRLPRSSGTVAEAIYNTSWNISSASLFEQILDELHEGIDEPFSLELTVEKQEIVLRFAASEHVVEVLSSGIYAMLPDAEIISSLDCCDVSPDAEIATADVVTDRNRIFALQNYLTLAFEPFSPIVAALLQVPSDTKVIIQIVCRPLPDTARHHCRLAVERAVFGGLMRAKPKFWFKRGVIESVRARTVDKCRRRWYAADFRIAAIHENYSLASSDLKRTRANLAAQLRAVASSFFFMNLIDDNRFRLKKIRFGAKHFEKFRSRRHASRLSLSSCELATLWHPVKQGALINTLRTHSRKLSPPPGLPTELNHRDICLVGNSNFRDHKVSFGLFPDEKRRHIQIVGKPGFGKSSLICSMIRDDLQRQRPLAVVDPKGDLVDQLLLLEASADRNNIILFDLTDPDHIPGFNPLAHIPFKSAETLANELVEIFRLRVSSTQSPAIEQLLRMCLLTLILIPGGTLVCLERLLTEPTFRARCLRTIRNAEVRHFWQKELMARSNEFNAQNIRSLLDQWQQIFADENMRLLFGQPASRLNFTEAIGSGKAIFIKLPVETLGPSQVSLIVSLILLRLHAACAARPVDERRSVSDVRLYIDDVHCLTENPLNRLLAEASNSGMVWTIAHETLSQLKPGTREIVLGNVGTHIIFQVNGEDSTAFTRELDSSLTGMDLANLRPQEFYIKTVARGETLATTSGQTPELPRHRKKRIAHSELIAESDFYCFPKNFAKQVRESWGRLDRERNSESLKTDMHSTC